MPAHVQRHAVDLVVATHPQSGAAPDLVQKYVRFGASPRGAQGLILAGKVSALMDGRPNVSVDDIRGLAAPVLRHRLVMGYEAIADAVSADALVESVSTWLAAMRRTIEQSQECGDLRADADASQLLFEIHGLILALHYEARFLHSEGSIERAHAGFNNILARYASEPPAA